MLVCESERHRRLVRGANNEACATGGGGGVSLASPRVRCKWGGEVRFWVSLRTMEGMREGPASGAPLRENLMSVGSETVIVGGMWWCEDEAGRANK